MDRLALLQGFVRVVELGSITAAAHDARVTQSTMSKRLAALERELGTPLVDRSTRRMRLTDAGRVLAEHAGELLDGWEATVAAVREEVPRLAGRLRISLPAVFGTRHVVPLLGSFLDAHPEIEAELLFADRYVDLLGEDVHVAIRVGASVPSTLRARRLGGTPRRLVASPRYLAARGTPRTPRDLRDHRALLHTSASSWTITLWDITSRVPLASALRADNSEAIRQLAVQGQGIAMLAAWLVDEDLARGDLVAVLPDAVLPPAPIRALLPPSRTVPQRVTALLDHLAGAWVDRGLDV